MKPFTQLLVRLSREIPNQEPANSLGSFPLECWWGLLEHKHPVRCTPLLRWLCTRRNNNKLHLKQKTSASPPASPYVKVLSTPSATKAEHSPSWQRNCVHRIQLHYYETVKMLFAQWFLILCYHMDCSLPGSSVHGVFQARILKWVLIPFSRGSFQPRAWTCVSCIAGRFFTIWATRAARTIMKQCKERRIWSWKTKNWWLAQWPWHKIVVLFLYCFIPIRFPFKNWMRWKMS